jgi:hypothetical protein
MHYDKVGDGAYFYLGVPRTLYYGFIHHQVKNVRIWMAHVGNWAVPIYQKRIVSTLDTIADLRKIFGKQFVAPLQVGEVGGDYNSNPANGEVCGFIHFLDYTKSFTLSVCTSK